MSNDDRYSFEHDHDDLLGDMTPAAFHAPAEWWHRLLERLDDDQVDKLRAGELFVTMWGATGVDKVALVPPLWLFDVPPPAA